MARPGQNSAKKKPTLEMLIDLTHIIMVVLGKLSFEQVQNLLSKKAFLQAKLVEVFGIVLNPDPFADIRLEWEKFYLDHFDVSADFTDVVIPPKPSDGEWRPIFILKGLTMNQTLAAMQEKFKVWVRRECEEVGLDAFVTFNARTTTASYAVWVRAGDEPDITHIGRSTRDADMSGRIGVTLLERMLLEMKYSADTGKNLDLIGATICTGSRDANGGVLIMYSHPEDNGRLVNLAGVDFSGSTDGLREAVSL
ncbi:MAG: hypothetical protein ABL899_00760 [Nitrospira sp.]